MQPPVPRVSFFLSYKRRFMLGAETFSSFLSISAEILVHQVLDVAMKTINCLVGLTKKINIFELILYFFSQYYQIAEQSRMSKFL